MEQARSIYIVKPPCLGLAEVYLAEILLGSASENFSQIHLRGFTLKLVSSILDRRSNVLTLPYSMEFVGRFPSADESKNMEISLNTPVWLPAGGNELEENVKDKMKTLRKCLNVQRGLIIFLTNKKR